MDPSQVISVFKRADLIARFPHGLSITDYSKAADVSFNTAQKHLEVCEALGLIKHDKIASSKIYNLKENARNHHK